jgi:hypothetical protein
MDQTAIQPFLDRLVSLGIATVAALFAGGLTAGFFYFLSVYFRLKKREQMSLEMITLEVKLQKENEIKIDAAEQMFASFTTLKKGGFFSFMEVDDVIAFEIIGKQSEIRFYVSAPAKIIDLIEKTIYGYYSSADIHRVEEPNIFSEQGAVAYGAFVQKDLPYMPIKTYKDLPTDPLSSLILLFQNGRRKGAIIQFLVNGKTRLEKAGKSYVSSTKKISESRKATFKTDPKILERIDDKCTRSDLKQLFATLFLSYKRCCKYSSRNIVRFFAI